jgi:hypothetical protein
LQADPVCEAFDGFIAPHAPPLPFEHFAVTAFGEIQSFVFGIHMIVLHV